jgi:integrase
VRGAKAAVISRPFDGISCRHAGEGVERVDRERSLVSHSQADRRGAAQWNHRRGRGRQSRRRTHLSQKGTRLGNWLTRDQAKELLTVPDRSKIKGKRDYVILALLLGCALRRQELASLDVDGIQMREGRWVLPDLRGKGGRVRTVAIPVWVKHGIDSWMVAAKIEDGRLLRPLSKSGKLIGDELGDWAIWSVVEQSAKEIGIERFGVHDLRRTCAKLCRRNGGDLEQIKFLLGHSSIQTTERYLGSEQELAVAVNDNLGL